MGSSHLREGDVDLLFDVIAGGRREPDGDSVPWSLLDGLQRLIPCDLEVTYQRHDYRHRTTMTIQYVEEGGTRGVADHDELNGEFSEQFWDLWWRSTCSWPQRTGNLREVSNSTDFFPTERERLADPCTDLRPESKYSLNVEVPAPPGEARRFICARGVGPAFSERDRQVLELLRPHLVEICAEAEQRRSVPPQLTPREWEVLAMAAAGLSYADIARVLVLSPSTVRKHMEHVRSGLGVHSLAAAARALPFAPPPEPRAFS